MMPKCKISIVSRMNSFRRVALLFGVGTFILAPIFPTQAAVTGILSRATVSNSDLTVVQGTWIKNAVTERKIARPNGPAALGPHRANRATFFGMLQTEAEALPSYFVNDNIAIVGQTNATMFDLASWRADAGLNSNGFRRVLHWDGVGSPTYSYGFAQSGDVIGSWIFDDLRECMASLKWTTVKFYPGSYPDVGEQKYTVVGLNGADCAARRDYAISQYPNNWTQFNQHALSGDGAYAGPEGTPPASWPFQRVRGRPYGDTGSSYSITNHVTRGATIYLTAQTPPIGGATYRDLDGFFGDPAVLVLYTNWTAQQFKPLQGSQFDPDNRVYPALFLNMPDVCPIDSANPVICSDSATPFWYRGYQIVGVVVVKWDFVYTQ